MKKFFNLIVLSAVLFFSFTFAWEDRSKIPCYNKKIYSYEKTLYFNASFTGKGKFRVDVYKPKNSVLHANCMTLTFPRYTRPVCWAYFSHPVTDIKDGTIYYSSKLEISTGYCDIRNMGQYDHFFNTRHPLSGKIDWSAW
jgi:hypothetical protein